KKPMYDRRCRARKDITKDQPHIIRVAVPLEGKIHFDDLIRGRIEFDNQDIDDFVLIRSNGAPTYNLSVVVDDVFQRMTHVIRGDDHINNTPKQMHLYHHFKYPVPHFAHLPMILGPDKKKLSKRHGAVSTNLYRAEGYLPEALLNFLARLGWSHGDQELFTIDELIQFFDFDHCQKSSAVFNTEKLLWTNGNFIRGANPERLQKIVIEDYSDQFTAPGSLEELKSPFAAKLVALIQPKVKLVKELADQLVPLCTPGTVEVDASELKWNKDANLKTATKAAVKHLTTELEKKASGKSSLHEAGLGHAEIEAALRQICDQHGVKLGDLAQPMRLTVTGRLVSAGLFELMSILPWKMVEPRLRKVETL
ncbi:MAG: glutamate--tRNA ligase, partial [Bdellovibrionota bacterium]